MGRSDEFVWEFNGPYLGPIAVTLGLPAVCYLLVALCNGERCLSLTDPPTSLAWLKLPSDQAILSTEGCVAAIWWVVLIGWLHLVLPGKKVQGTKLKNGDQLIYKLNGMLVLLLVYSAAIYLGFIAEVVDLGWMYDNYLALLTGSLAISVTLSVYLYVTSFKAGAVLATGGNSGVWIYDFFMGRELNPRVGSFDLKEFCELYPGLIGWVMLNLGCAHKEFTQTGDVSVPMLLVNAFHLLYVVDGLWFEPCILSTMDITTDGFGYMLAFGDLTWVPFTYSLQARILVDRSPELSSAFLMLIVALKVTGYIIFRGSNSQKDQFRRDPTHPSVAHLKTLKTESGRQLMVSGWWGISRHINYFGDWIMGLAWCLPCGAQPVAYFYAIYFAVLLIHRDGRDGHNCSLKYGKDWDKFKNIVKYHIVPYVY